MQFTQRQKGSVPTTNVSVTDALHLATAQYDECDILVTNDRGFLRIANKYIITELPKSLDIALDRLQQQLSSC